MATLVLATLGTALGGPIGGALGGIIGQSIDQNLFGPPARRGPRLGDLSVQTSSYGTPIARVYGRMRVAGTVVWATELREEEVVAGGGKGAPGGVSYAYSASFAVALSSRPAQSVRRIWADGKLLRGADGAFKTKAKFRFQPGSERQPVDPLIASIEGAGGAPAFRGTALAVFEDLALADFGNRIPSLTFELIADTQAPQVAAVITDISGGVIERGDDERTVGGFAALGNDRRSALEPLVDLWGATYCDDGERLRSVPAGLAVVAVGDAGSCGCVVEGDAPVSRIERDQEPADALPRALTVEYYDPARDYQAGQMRASMSSGGRSQRRIDSASVLDAHAAKSLASDMLARRWAGRDRVTLRLAPSFMALRPGQLVAVAGAPGRFRIDTVTLDGLVTVVQARRIASGASSLAADHGRGVLSPDIATGQSVPFLLDVPATGSGELDGFGMTRALGSTGPFKPTTVAVEANGQPLSSLRVDRAAVVGIATSVLAAGSTNMLDAINSVEVQLSNPEALLYHADDAALAMGANAMAIGAEIIQFGRALALGDGAYRLSGLTRGRNGTEWAVGGHATGDAVILIEPASLVRIRLDPSMIGAAITVRAYGVADDESDPPTASGQARGESLRPMSPCHLNATMDAASLNVRWVARRAAYGWSGSVDEGATSTFEVTLRRGDGVARRSTTGTALTLPAAEVDALGSGTIEIEVVEQGPVPSRAAWTTLDA